jgi:SAM-dependent methyltransferase
MSAAGAASAGGPGVLERLRGIVRYYERPIIDHPLFVDYYGGSDFLNFGYWTQTTTSQKQACENLMERLLAFIPEKKGRILDVACGKGATTRHLLRYYPAADVTGINISPKQIEASRQNAPGCSFALMDAVRLGFASGSFTGLISVEAAFHFDTREAFLREAHRVLRPGGRIVLSDIVVARWAARMNPRIGLHNYVGTLEDYRAVFAATGFRDVEIVDSTTESWTRFSEKLWSFRRDNYRAGRIDRKTYYRMCLNNVIARRGLKHYLLVGATRA